MNENIDLTKILKDRPKGTKFYSSIYGEVEVAIFCDDNYPIKVFCPTITGIVTPLCYLSKDGRYNRQFNGECTLFPSKDQRDWSKFSAPWYNKEKFDPKTLKPFDKVIGRDLVSSKWECNLFSHIAESTNYPYRCIGNYYKLCIPYNDETKHLVGTTEEAPEYFRYWED